MKTDLDRRKVAREAKAIVALAFRNGPIEDLHAGRECPCCAGRTGFSRITNAEMKAIMKNAVDGIYTLLLLREQDPAKYESQMRLGDRHTAKWDEPEVHQARRPDLGGRRY